MSGWNSGSHNKYLLQYHLIYVCKYRKQLFSNKSITDDTKRLSNEICQKHKVNIKYMEVDKDHIHYMIETRPNINLSDFVRTMKSYITYHIIYGRYTKLTYENVFGKNEHYLQMGISYVQLVM